MTEWNRAAELPGLPSQGYFSSWPEIKRNRKELAEAMPTPGRRWRPTVSAITRMEETIIWNGFLQPEEARGRDALEGHMLPVRDKSCYRPQEMGVRAESDRVASQRKIRKQEAQQELRLLSGGALTRGACQPASVSHGAFP